MSDVDDNPTPFFRRRLRLLGLALAAAAALLGGCGGDDADWEVSSNAAVLDADHARQAGKYEDCLSLLQQALKLNPYNSGANFSFAMLYEENLFERPGATALALLYYKRFLDLGLAGESRRAEAEARVAALEMLAAGKVEDPAGVVREFIAGCVAGSAKIAVERYHDNFITALMRRGVMPTSHMEEWKNFVGQSKWELVLRCIRRDNNSYKAEVLAQAAGGKRRLYLVLMPDSTWKIYGDAPE